MQAQKPEYEKVGNDIKVSVLIKAEQVPSKKADGSAITDGEGNPVMVVEDLSADLIQVASAATQALRKNLNDEHAARNAPAIIASQQALVGKKMIALKA